MFRKINNVFRPNPHGHKGRGDGGGFRSRQDYHDACTVRLVRSTSMLVVRERAQTAEGSTLKRSKSTVSVESTLYYYQRQEDRIWLYSQNQNCLEYLEALMALRRQYTQSVSNLKSNEAKAAESSKKKKPAPAAPTKEEPVRLNCITERIQRHKQKKAKKRCHFFVGRYREPNPPHLRPLTRRTHYSSLMRSSPAVTTNLCANLTGMTAMLM